MKQLFNPNHFDGINKKPMAESHFYKWLERHGEEWIQDTFSGVDNWFKVYDHLIMARRYYLHSLGFDKANHYLESNVITALKYIHQYYFDVNYKDQVLQKFKEV